MEITFAPFLLAVVGGVIYQISQRLIPEHTNPFLALSLAYAFAFAACSLALLIDFRQKHFVLFSQLHWSVLLLGVGTFFIEFGYLYAFRTGAKLSSFGASVMAAVVVLLVIIGLVFFKEALTLQKMIGILFCIIGVVFIRI
jgi:drug/metabolite transporter (DMT)-like permease